MDTSKPPVDGLKIKMKNIIVCFYFDSINLVPNVVLLHIVPRKVVCVQLISNVNSLQDVENY